MTSARCGLTTSAPRRLAIDGGSVDLIDTKDIAADLKLGRDYVTRSVVKRPEFPRPVLVLSRKVVKWARSEYEAWKANHYERVRA